MPLRDAAAGEEEEGDVGAPLQPGRPSPRGRRGGRLRKAFFVEVCVYWCWGGSRREREEEEEDVGEEAGKGGSFGSSGRGEKEEEGTGGGKVFLSVACSGHLREAVVDLQKGR